MSAKELQEIISPKFTEEVLFDIVKKKSGLNNVTVKKIVIGATSKKGDSYLSNVCRFDIEATGKNTVGTEEITSFPVIVKYIPKNVARRKTYRSADFFENEVIFYDKVWAALQKFQNSKNIKHKFDNIPLVLAWYIDGSNDYIAMFDVSYQGYKSAERGGGLNREYALQILRVLAQFHALSLAFKDQQPEAFEAAATSLKETYFAEKFRYWYSRFQESLVMVVRDAVEKELPPLYLERFDRFSRDDLYGNLCKLCQLRGPFAGIVHGDVWVPNFLVKNGPEDTIEHIIMIDFQLTRYTSVATDVTFFLNTCVDFNVMEQNWDILVGEYHKALTNTLEKYGSSRSLVTLEALNEEIRATIGFGLGMSMESLTLSLLEDNEIVDLDGIKGDDAVPIETVWIMHPKKEQAKRKKLSNMIKFAVDKNFI